MVGGKNEQNQNEAYPGLRSYQENYWAGNWCCSTQDTGWTSEKKPSIIPTKLCFAQFTLNSVRFKNLVKLEANIFSRFKIVKIFEIEKQSSWMSLKISAKKKNIISVTIIYEPNFVDFKLLWLNFWAIVVGNIYSVKDLS